MTADRTVWEYETLRPPREATKHEAKDPKDELNELGLEGWELVTTIEYSGGGTKYLVFRRPTDAADASESVETEDAAETVDAADASTE